MNALKKHLSSMSVAEQAKFAVRSGTTIRYLRKIISIQRPIHPKTCVFIEKESGGKVTRQDLRPDDWQEIWPELAEKKH